MLGPVTSTKVVIPANAGIQAVFADASALEGYDAFAINWAPPSRGRREWLSHVWEIGFVPQIFLQID
jgi:hypothetical protein